MARLRFKKRRITKGRRVVKRKRSKASTKIGSIGNQNRMALKPGVQRTLNPFPPTMFAKMVYGVNIVVDATAVTGLSVSWIHRLNSLFDPDQTSTGHQPYQFDQLSSMYRRYQVYGASFRITATDPTRGMVVGICVRPSTDSSSSMTSRTVDYIYERRLTNVRAINDSGSQKTSWKGYVKMQQVFGVTKSQFNSGTTGQYDAAYNANPTDIVALECWAIDPNGTGLTASIRFVGSITYYAKLWEFLGPSQS